MSSRQQENRRQALRRMRQDEQFLKTLEFHIAILTPAGKAELAASILAKLAVQLDDQNCPKAAQATTLVLMARGLQERLQSRTTTKSENEEDGK